jgi:hypothetical protein
MVMMYNSQKFWVSGLRPSSEILNIRKHNVSETGSASTLLGSLQKANLNHWLTLSKGTKREGVFLTSPEDGNRSSVRNVVFFCI